MLGDLIKQLAGYGAASLVALAVDVGLYSALVKFAKLGYVAAATISFLVGVVVVYVLSTWLAFRQHRFGNVRTEFLLFVAIGILGLLINDTVIAVATAQLGIDYIAAKFLATGFTFLCNFLLRRQMLFVKATTAKETHVASDQPR